MSSNDPRGEDPIQSQERRAAFALELESLPAGKLPPLIAYACDYRRLWLVAVPGVGLRLL